MNNAREEFKGELVALLLHSTAVGQAQATEWAELVDQILWSMGGASYSELFDQLIDKFQMWLIGQMQQQVSLLDIDLETIYNFLLTASYNLCRGVSHKTNVSSTTTAGLPRPLASSSSSLSAGELIARQKAELANSEAADRAKEKAKQESLDEQKQIEERNEESPEARRARLLGPLHRRLSAAPPAAPPSVSSSLSSSFGIQGLGTPPLRSIQGHSSSSPSGQSQVPLERKTCAPVTPNNRDIKQQVPALNACDSLKL